MVSVLHFLPLLLFFTSYKFFDIYVATSTLMVSSSISFAMCWYIQKKIMDIEPQILKLKDSKVKTGTIEKRDESQDFDI